MGKQTLNLTDELYQYLLSVSLRESEIAKALREETDTLEYARMQISADQAQFMALLIKLLSARNVIEVGTFTGYSALSMAQALPESGKLIACDISEEWTAIAKRYWQRANLDNKIDLHLAPALDTLNQLITEKQENHFDFAFIDADKENLKAYYQACFQLVRPGGVIAIDNVLWGGSVIDADNHEQSTIAIREFNDFINRDERVEISLVPIGDGLTLALKR